MKLIKLTKGFYTKVDDDFYEYLMQWKWHVQKNGKMYYAVRGGHIKEFINGKRPLISIHRIVLGLSKSDMICDHIDHDGLNNQRNNLRTVTVGQNSSNRIKKKGISKYSGVSVIKYNQRIVNYRTTITKDKKTLYLGRFPYTPEGELLAAKAYDKKAKELFGEFSSLNFPV